MSSSVGHQFISSLNTHAAALFDNGIKMPVAQDWRVTPWSHVDEVFKAHCADGAVDAVDPAWEKRVQESFASKLGADPAAWADLIPSLNETPQQRLVDGQLVRFRCMVQDMFDPEFYLSVFEVRDLATGLSRLASGRYRDAAPVGPREEVALESAATKNGDRQTLYCVSVPGETPWVREEHRRRAETTAHSGPQAGTSGGAGRNNALKRNLDEDSNDAKNGNESAQGEDSMETSADGDKCDNSKKVRTDSGEAVNSGKKKAEAGGPQFTLNLPIPAPHGRACLVKVYDGPSAAADGGKSTFSLNELVEFVGIVSLDPSLASEGATDGAADLDANDLAANIGVVANDREKQARSPPPSLVPRLHVVAHRRLSHCHPTMPAAVPSATTALQADATRCRAELHALLTKLTLGDSLAADYLICHLVSRVYLRRDVLTLGKFSVNLFNVPLHESYSKRLATVLQLLVDRAHYLPLTVGNLNKLEFVPKKDYEANRLVTGLLQLSEGTRLMIDETAMDAGQLDPKGVRNLTALGSLIRWQRLEYDFQYHRLEFEHDVACLVLSEGRSMLPSDCQVMIRPSSEVGGAGPNAIGEAFSAVGSALDPQLLARTREYLCAVRRLEFEVTEEAQKAVQEDFVYERQQQQQGGRLTAEDLHHMLVLGRLMSLSEGRSTLTGETWQKVKAMERERTERMAHLPRRNNDNNVVQN